MPEDFSVQSVFAGLTLSTGDAVKNQFTFAEHYEGYGFFGTLSVLTHTESYKIKLSKANTLTTSGTPVSIPMSKTLNSGWTWIPYPFQIEVSLKRGMPTFAYSGGDACKSFGEFTEYYDGYGWYGTLTTLRPGYGYTLKTANKGTATFNSP